MRQADDAFPVPGDAFLLHTKPVGTVRIRNLHGSPGHQHQIEQVGPDDIAQGTKKNKSAAVRNMAVTRTSAFSFRISGLPFLHYFLYSTMDEHTFQEIVIISFLGRIWYNRDNRKESGQNQEERYGC